MEESYQTFCGRSQICLFFALPSEAKVLKGAVLLCISLCLVISASVRFLQAVMGEMTPSRAPPVAGQRNAPLFIKRKFIFVLISIRDGN